MLPRNYTYAGANGTAVGLGPDALDVQPLVINLGKDMTVRHEYVGPAVIIEVTEAHTTSQISGIAAQTALQDSVVEGSVAIVVVQIRRVIRIVRLNNVQPTVTVIIADGHAHAALHSAVLVHRATDF